VPGYFSFKEQTTMMIPIFDGQNFGYCYEAETGHYLLHDEDFRNHVYLQGDDARMFREQIENIGNRNNTEEKTISLTENTISLYL
jgi:hypothetical protein